VAALRGEFCRNAVMVTQSVQRIRMGFTPDAAAPPNTLRAGRAVQCASFRDAGQMQNAIELSVPCRSREGFAPDPSSILPKLTTPNQGIVSLPWASGALFPRTERRFPHRTAHASRSWPHRRSGSPAHRLPGSHACRANKSHSTCRSGVPLR